MDANKKFDLVNPQCPNESKILVDILNNQPLRTCVATSVSVLWIYMAQFWHTLKVDQSKFKFVLDTKELTMTVADFRYIFRLPQATDNNHAGFVDASIFSQMVPFYRNALGFSLTLKSPSNFMSKGLPQPWQTLFHDNYHRVKNDDLVKNIFNSRKNKKATGLNIPTWKLIEEIKLTAHYQMITSAPRLPNPEVTKGESSDQRKSTVIRLRVPPKRQDPETSIPTAVEIDNVERVKERMVDEELEQLLEETENVAKKDADMVIINAREEEESAGDEFELRKRNNGKGLEEIRDSPSPTPIRSIRTHIAPLPTDKDTL
ncbi:hypothetical protein Tco_0703427 [Tanacetum coccineum]|uniref:Uncharacterized protein n=1 Tax=Tanacetum coccineum TaxID=301880 RepID=A0ABQ4XZA6_9ASTR